MRGHWISQIRKLNRHYQSITKSKPVTPQIISYGSYYLDVDTILICYGVDYYEVG